MQVIFRLDVDPKFKACLLQISPGPSCVHLLCMTLVMGAVSAAVCSCRGPDPENRRTLLIFNVRRTPTSFSTRHDAAAGLIMRQDASWTGNTSMKRRHTHVLLLLVVVVDWVPEIRTRLFFIFCQIFAILDAFSNRNTPKTGGFF